jgi:pantoate--beta-alanine ligase
MRNFTQIRDIREFLHKEQAIGRTVGFIPTMGALHEGHLSLISCSKAENDITACSIFVNPIQFNNKNDLEKYPRSVEADLRILEKAGCDVVFTPSVDEMYPEDIVENLNINFGLLDKILEGLHRPGHFNGVAIVVKKLFDIIQPQKAYFGKKDYQQLMVIRSMIKQLDYPVQIVPCPIIREKDGLAMSSRNMRLTIGERQMAPMIYNVLSEVKEKTGSMTVAELKNWALKKFEENPAFNIEYFEISNKETLEPLINWKEKENSIILIAVFLGDIRLIDNLELFL